MSILFLREIGESAQWNLLEPNRNLVLFRIVLIFNLHWELGLITPAPNSSSNGFLCKIIKVAQVGRFLESCIFVPLYLLMDSVQTRMGPDCPIKSPSILWGTSSPTSNLFEAILVLMGCLHTVM
jgi:hypothetical protein